MANEAEFLAATTLNKGSYAFTIPKEIREELDITMARFRVLNFNLEKDTNEVSINIGKQANMGTSEFPSSNQVTVPLYARKYLKLEKGISKIGFYKYKEKVLFRKMN